MNVLVTGGAGYIGSHTCVELLNAGYDVVLLDNFSNSSTDVPRRINELTGRVFTVYAIDLLHLPSVERVFNEINIDAVIHFAGLKAVGESVSMPLEYYHNNVVGTINLLDVMRKSGCKRMVFSSSATVYGDKNPIPYVETMPLSAINPYGSTKVVIEGMLRDLSASDCDWSIVPLRYFNPIGAHISGLLGDSPRGIPNNLLPYISQVAVGIRENLNVFGNDYPTPDGTCIRDYLHVTDLALGHIAALEYIMKSKGLEAINLGAGKGYSVLEIITAFEKVSGVTIPYVIAPRRAGDLSAFYADASKAEKLLGWKVKRSVDEMCSDSWRFIKTNPRGT